MKLAIMQPYLFPYLGYYKLLAQVDKWVFYDDVNFIKNGWINRNRLYLAGAVRYITAPLVGASSFTKICDIDVQEGAAWRAKMLDSVRLSYAKAPHYQAVSALLAEVLHGADPRIGAIAKHSVTAIAAYLGLPTAFVMTSSGYANADLHGVDRVLDICVKEGASDYLNLPGGRALYDPAVFSARGVALGFVDVALEPYPQFAPQFEPGLSMLDVLMFNDRASARAMLGVAP